ncbi:TetR family transcriptional regulator [Streptomyces sp. 846.5]|nr:TetR family transcriptional regulator [Streptomyces sp. 846.5]TDU04499.1 TetR family transcriptional regulator [Streptomyces sp. 846.5]
MTPAPPKSLSSSSVPAAASAAGLEELLAAPLGLRERKKLKTRRAIRAAAFRLFSTQGYDATTVDQIAADADVSPSTFFRYFPTKEDLVITDDYDPVMEAALRARPLGEPVMESVRQAILPPLRRIMEAESEDMLLRMRLLNEVPAIRSRSVLEMLRSRDVIVAVLAERTGRPEDDLGLRALVSATLSACSEAVEYWFRNDGAGNVADLCEQALKAVAEGLSG